jgi:UDP-N-acetylglucosamine:LPS N-acetylglucosamine transferase
MVRIARRMALAKSTTQFILLCGRNRDLFEQISGTNLPFPAHVQGFTENVAHYMSLSDFFRGKPGPGSVSEALAMGLPVIVEAGSKTLAQERYNVEWIQEQAVGSRLTTIKDLPQTISSLLRPTSYQSMRQRIQALSNRAVFEVPDVLELPAGCLTK